jgi:hypothetical protein
MTTIDCEKIGHYYDHKGICIRCSLSFQQISPVIEDEPPPLEDYLKLRPPAKCKHGITPEARCGHCEGRTPDPITPPVPTMPHAHALYEEAERTISGPRRGDYGDAAESFRRIALTWSAVLGVKVTPQQVALCMVGLKICREANAHKHDSLVDICGYTGLIAEMEAAPASSNPL